VQYGVTSQENWFGISEHVTLSPLLRQYDAAWDHWHSCVRRQSVRARMFWQGRSVHNPLLTVHRELTFRHCCGVNKSQAAVTGPQLLVQF